MQHLKSPTELYVILSDRIWGNKSINDHVWSFEVGHGYNNAWTRADLHRAVQELSRALAQVYANDKGASGPVGVYLDNSMIYVASVLAAWSLDCSVFPLDSKTIHEATKGCMPWTIIWADVGEVAGGIGRPESSVHSIQCISRGSNNDISTVCASGDSYCETIDVPRDCAYWVKTSGTSSGKPYRSFMPTACIHSRIHWQHLEYPWLENDLGSFHTSTQFVDHVSQLLSPLYGGAGLVCVSKSVYLDHDAFLSVLSTNFRPTEAIPYYITHLTLTPTLYTFLLLASEQSYQQAFKHIRLAISSGEILYSHTLKKMQSRFPISAAILNVYGISEAGADSTYFDCSVSRYSVPEQDFVPIPVGKTLPGYRITLDSSNQVNILWGEKFTRTGDMGKFDDDVNLVILGRCSDLSKKIKGEMFNLTEIRNRILYSIDEVYDTKVVYLERSDFLVVFLFVVPSADFSSVRAACRQVLGGTSSVRILNAQSDLPLNASGKIDLVTIYKSLEQNIGGSVASITRESNGHNEWTESRLKKVFSKHLMIDSLEPIDSLFDLGGSSRTAALIARDLGIADPLVVFENSTIRQLINVLQGGTKRQKVSNNKEICCFTLIDCLIWKRSFLSCIDSPTLVVNGCTVCCADNSGRIELVDTISGRCLHSSNLDASVTGYMHLSNDLIIVPTDSSVILCCPKTLDNHVIQGISLSSRAKPAIVLDHAVFGTYDNCIISLSLTEKRVTFRYPLAAAVSAPVEFSQDLASMCFAASTCGDIIGFDVINGSRSFQIVQKWIYSMGNAVLAQPLCFYCPGLGSICLLCVSTSGHIVCTCAETGILHYQKFVEVPGFFMRPIQHECLDGFIILISRGGSIWLLQTCSGHVEKMCSIPDVIHKYIFLPERMAIVLSSSRQVIWVLHIQKEQSGQQDTSSTLRTVELMPVLSFPAEAHSMSCHGSKLFLGCRDENLYCLNIEKMMLTKKNKMQMK
jgi:acyl-coenzyme A synthetase/AMP-(fatty) acid ligase